MSCAGGLLLLLLVSVARAQPAPEHPARELIDRAAYKVRSDPEASNRDTLAALEVLAKRPDADLEIRARLLLCDHLSERDRAAAEQQIALARALLPRSTRPGLESGIYDCEGTVLETAGDNTAAADRFERAVAIAESTNDSEMLAGALFSRGYLLGVQGRYAAGLGDLKRAQPSTLSDSQDEFTSVMEGTPISRIMIQSPITVAPETPLLAAAETLQSTKYGALPVVEDGKVVGILTDTDLIRTLVDLLRQA